MHKSEKLATIGRNDGTRTTGISQCGMTVDVNLQKMRFCGACESRSKVRQVSLLCGHHEDSAIHCVRLIKWQILRVSAVVCAEASTKARFAF